MESSIAISATPISWGWRRLSDLSIGVYDCPHSTPQLTDAGPFVARTQDIGSGVFRMETAAHVSAETYLARITRAEPTWGDLLYSREGTYFGIAAEVPRKAQVCLGQRMVLIRPDQKLLDHRFLRYWLNSGPMADYIAAHKDGSVAQRVNLPIIRQIPVPLPSLDEQQAIAETLGTIDNKIESNLKAIAVASALLDAMAVQHGSELPSVPLARLVSTPKNTVNPKTLGEQVVDHYSLPAFDDGARPERTPASTIMSNKLAVPHEAILVSRLNPRFNRTWWVGDYETQPKLASTEFLVLTAETDIELAGVWLAVRDPSFMSELARRVTGTSGSHQRVRPEDALAIEVADVTQLDASTKQHALALLTRIHQLRDESASLKLLRDALLPELLSGRIRVPVEESAA